MTLQEKVEKLLNCPGLDVAERQGFQFMLDVNGDTPLEGKLFPEVEAHIIARFEWYFTPSGAPRTKTI